MTGLASLFAKVTEGLAPGRDDPTSGFPVSGTVEPVSQRIEHKYISGISGVSGPRKIATEFPAEDAAQACASARAGVRARGARVGSPEIPETPENRAGPRGSLSGSLSLNPENRKKEGGEDYSVSGSLASLPFDERAAFLEYECGLPRAQAEDQARREFAADPEEAGLAHWRSALGRMGADTIPCPGYRGSEWPMTLARALTFLDTFGEQAVALGWTAPRLFGVHSAAGIVRVDVCGALALPGGGAIRAITATEIAFGHLTYRTTPGQPEGVPIWRFGR